MAEWGEVLEGKEFRQLDDKGELVNVYRFTGKTKKGMTFTEIIKEADTKPETVDKILGEKARRLDKILAL